jgi:hypothetical protein
MADPGYDIIAEDDNYEKLGEEAIRISGLLEEKLEQYTQSLGRIISDAISSGNVSKNLATYQSTVGTLKGASKEISDKIHKCAEAFIEDMDKADASLF